MTIHVRPRTADDLAELGEALVRVHTRDGYPVEGVDDPIAWLTPDHLLAAWTALEDDRPIGQATLARAASEDDAAQLWHQHTGKSIDRLAIPARLFVDPEKRNKRAGLRLMQEIQAYARGHALEIAFDVMLKDRTAIRLYEATGCVRIGTITHHHGQQQSEPAAVYVMPMA